MKHRKEKSLRIGSAVIRGRKDRYEFEVFPLDVEMQPVPAVYVISRRVTDREGRGHHKFVCIGETESLALELKKQKKGKCIKKFKANVVSVLPTESENARVSIAEDLKATHSIPCLSQAENAAPEIESSLQALGIAPKIEKKSAKKISPVIAKPAPVKEAKPKIEKAEKKVERKIEAPRPQAAKPKTVTNRKAKSAKHLNEKATAKTKSSILKEIDKTKIKKTAAVKSVKLKTQSPKKAESVKAAKISSPKPPVLEKKEKPKDKLKVAQTTIAKAKPGARKAKKDAPIQKPKAASVAQSPKKSVPKTVKASETKKTASKNELKTRKTTRTAVTAVENKKKADSKKKVESPRAKAKASGKPGATRKRLAI